MKYSLVSLKGALVMWAMMVEDKSLEIQQNLNQDILDLWTFLASSVNTVLRFQKSGNIVLNKIYAIANLIKSFLTCYNI